MRVPPPASAGLEHDFDAAASLSRKVLYMDGPSERPTQWVMTKDGTIWPSSIRCSRSSVHRFTCVWPVLMACQLAGCRIGRRPGSPRERCRLETTPALGDRFDIDCLRHHSVC